MNHANAPRFDVSVVHHRLPRRFPGAADRGLPAGFEPTVRGAFHLADSLEMRLVGAPKGEPPLRLRRLRVQAMTHAGDLLVGGWAVRATAGATTLDVLRTRFGVAAEGVRERRGPFGPRPFPPGPEGRRTGTPREQPSAYPLARDARRAAQPWLPWLLPHAHGQVQRLRLRPALDALLCAQEAAPQVDPFWSRACGGGEVVAESAVSLRGVAVEGWLEAPRPLLAAGSRARLPRCVAAVA